MYVSSAIPIDSRRAAMTKLEEALQPDEALVGVFSCIRIRRNISVLAITTGRVITLGQKMLAGTVIIDDIPATIIKSVRTQWDGVKAGEVQLETTDGHLVLGAIPTKVKDDRLTADVYLRELTKLGNEGDVELPSATSEDLAHGIQLDSGSQTRGEILIRQLNELAQHYHNGDLTDEEFAAAKAAVIVSV